MNVMCSCVKLNNYNSATAMPASPSGGVIVENFNKVYPVLS